MTDCILVDWLTFSTLSETKDSVIDFIGLTACKWEEGKASSLHYAECVQVKGITVHYTPAEYSGQKKYNKGVCVEMSGTGCRFFETYSDKSFIILFRALCFGIKHGTHNVTRCDLACDDHTGMIDIECMRQFTENDWYTCIMSVCKIEKSRKNQKSPWGLSIYHGKREGNVSFRIYDKRVEREAFDLDHWIRFEIQLRKDGANGFICQCFGGDDWQKLDIGIVFAGIIKRYLEYKCPGNDSNVSRWRSAPWWSRFLGECEKFYTIARKDLEYNKERMDRYAYRQNHNHTMTEIEMDGLGSYLLQLHSFRDDLPQKYRTVATAAANSSEILRRLDEMKQETGSDYLRRCRADIDKTLKHLDAAAAMDELGLLRASDL